MTVIFEKMAMLVFMLAAGYAFAGYKIVSPEFNKGLTKLIMNFFLVGMILNSVINKQIDMTGGELLLALGIWALMFVISVGVGYAAPRLLRMKGDRGMYSLLVGFMNNGFIGMPLIVAVYGTEALFFASLSNIPFNLILYTLGLVVLQGSDGETKFELKRAINAPIIATLVAIVIFFTGVRVPQFIADTVEMISDATAPISMMCVGLALGAVPLKDAFVHPKLYLLAIIRNIVCPLITWLALKGLIADTVMLGTLVILSACPSAVICTILGIEYGRDGIESSEGILLSTVLSMITIPLLVSVLGLA